MVLCIFYCSLLAANLMLTKSIPIESEANQNNIQKHFDSILRLNSGSQDITRNEENTYRPDEEGIGEVESSRPFEKRTPVDVENKIFVKERVMTGPFGFHVGNKHLATGQSNIETSNQENFLQTANNVQSSQTNNDIVDVEVSASGRSNVEGSERANNGADSFMMPKTDANSSKNYEPYRLKSIESMSDGSEISSQERQSDQSIYGRKGIMLDRHFSIGDHGYVGDMNNVATESGNIEASTGIVDNQGHNYVLGSDRNDELIISVPSADFF
ncbi:uncharacterized protein LOC141851006 isoform X2 [Brevipalpus obovatus]|uniref:uncharacterized protein LOC141851006 isoform X2 n=1 Tax=Brevipalpus obovatus TaxID=246614 RepID=UPI003D9E6DC5